MGEKGNVADLLSAAPSDTTGSTLGQSLGTLSGAGADGTVGEALGGSMSMDPSVGGAGGVDPRGVAAAAAGTAGVAGGIAAHRAEADGDVGDEVTDEDADEPEG